MACGITVAPRIEAAISTESVPWKRGIRPRTTAAGSGGATNRPAMNPKVMTSSITMMIRSNVVCVLPPWNHSITVEAAPITRPPTNNDRPNSRLRAIAPPITSARSVAMAMTSACMKNMNRPALPIRSPSSSGRLLPVTMPSFADWY